MITFKNRFAEFDNLDDSQNDNVLKKCYYKEFHRNFLRFHGPNNIKGNQRYASQNYNDIRLKNFINNNNTLINSHRQNSFTPFPKIPLNFSSNINNFRSIQSNNNNFTQRQNVNLLKSSPNYNNIRNNIIYTSIPSHNNFNNNSFNNTNNTFNNN